MFMRDISLWFSFIMCFSDLDIKIKLASWEELESISSSSVFWNYLYRVGIL